MSVPVSRDRVSMRQLGLISSFFQKIILGKFSVNKGSPGLPCKNGPAQQQEGEMVWHCPAKAFRAVPGSLIHGCQLPWCLDPEYLGEGAAGILDSSSFPVACFHFQKDKLPEGCESGDLAALFGQEAFAATSWGMGNFFFRILRNCPVVYGVSLALHGNGAESVLLQECLPEAWITWPPTYMAIP